jgi:polysaccharide export outer membrane protein
MKPFHLFGLLIILFMLLSSVETVRAADKKGYVLGEKDVVNLVVYAGEKQQIAADLTVDSTGRLSVPMIGTVKVKGLTLAELEQAIREPLAADYFVNPQVILTLKEFRSLSFYITGAVKNPGKYEMDQEPALMDLVGKAGGLAPEYGQTAYVTHDSGVKNDSKSGREEVTEVDISALLESGGNKGNIRLKNGDRVQVPFKTEMDQAKTNIFIDGEVKNPGMYPYRIGLTVLNACIMAGGFKEFAAPNRATIRRNGAKKEVIKVNLDAVKDGTAADLPLQPGDFIHIPETWL